VQQASNGAASSSAPELFAVPVDRGQYLIYAPSLGCAFVGNGGTVNALVAWRNGYGADNAADGALTKFFESLGLLQPSPVEHRSMQRDQSMGCDQVLIHIEDLECQLELVDEHTFADMAITSVESSIRSLERDNRRYSIRISLPIQYPKAFSAVIVRCCTVFKPQSVVIDALGGGPAGLDLPPEVNELLQALRSVRTLCESTHCAIVVPGAHVGHPSCLCGECRSLSPNRHSYCVGCFAKQHCLGACSTADNLRAPGSIHCHLVREATKDALLANIASASGLVWRQAALKATSS
jgi:hypothetical protein